MDFDVQWQLLSVLLRAFDEWPPNHGLVPPHYILDGEDEFKLELANQREQETLHPTQVKLVRTHKVNEGDNILTL